MNLPIGTTIKHYEGDIYKIIGTRKIRDSYKYILQNLTIKNSGKCSIRREFLLDALERKVFLL